MNAYFRGKERRWNGRFDVAGALYSVLIVFILSYFYFAILKRLVVRECHCTMSKVLLEY
jgi:hypothetical protein